MLWRDRLLLALWLVAAFLPGAAGVSLFDRDEGFYAQITKEMIETGDWIMPRYLGEPRLFKPPLVYWGAAASVSLLGFSEFALRLPGLLASVLAWILAAEHAGKWFGRSTAYWTAAIAGTCVGTTVAARMMLTDGYLLLFVTAGLCLWIDRIGAAPGAPQPRWKSHAFWACFAMAVLAKGPAVLIVVVPFGFASLLLTRRQGEGVLTLGCRFARCWPGPGWWLAALIAMPWFLTIAALDWPAFKEEFLLQHSLNRAGAPMEGHAGFVGYYVLCGLLLLWPWAAWMPRAFASAWSAAREHPPIHGLLLWLLAGGAAFEIVRTKLPHYGLVLTPPIVILTARYLSLLTRRMPKDSEARAAEPAHLADSESSTHFRALSLLGLLAGWLLLSAGLDGPWAIQLRHGLILLLVGLAATAVLLLVAAARPVETWTLSVALAGAGALVFSIGFHRSVDRTWMVVGCVVLLATATIMGVLWLRGHRRAAMAALVAGMTTTHAIVGWKILPLGEPYRLAHQAAAAVNAMPAPVHCLVTAGFAEPSMFYYARPPGREFRAESWDSASLAGRPVALVALSSRVESLRPYFEFELANGCSISGFNYVRGRDTTLWIGPAIVRPNPVSTSSADEAPLPAVDP